MRKKKLAKKKTYKLVGLKTGSVGVVILKYFQGERIRIRI